MSLLAACCPEPDGRTSHLDEGFSFLTLHRDQVVIGSLSPDNLSVRAICADTGFHEIPRYTSPERNTLFRAENGKMVCGADHFSKVTPVATLAITCPSQLHPVLVRICGLQDREYRIFLVGIPRDIPRKSNRNCSSMQQTRPNLFVIL